VKDLTGEAVIACYLMHYIVYTVNSCLGGWQNRTMSARMTYTSTHQMNHKQRLLLKH